MRRVYLQQLPLLLLLLFAHFGAIVGPNSEIYPYRRDRSSHIDSDQFTSDNYNSFLDSQTVEQRSRKTQLQQRQSQPTQQQQQQQNQQSYPPYSETRFISTNDAMKRLFILGPEPGLVLFNSIKDMPADESSFIDRSSNQEQSFKVQRTSDGKLNLVFNDLPFFQRPTDALTTPKPTRTASSTDFVYPDDPRTQWKPKCAESVDDGKPYCTKVQDYPDLAVSDSMLRSQLQKLSGFFGADFVQPDGFKQRTSSEPYEEYLCVSKERIIYPKSGLTKDKQWLYIVNMDDYKQGIRVEECVGAESPCKDIASFPSSYTATCKQNFIYRTMVALTPNGKNTTTEQFLVPSCCKCVLKPK